MVVSMMGAMLRYKQTAGVAWVLTLGLVAALGCGQAFDPGDEGDLFFVRRDGARFPVWVRGNLESDTVLVIVHGGPGSTGTQYFHMNAFSGVEDLHAVVYWEQRASGFSFGRGPGGQNNLNARVGAFDLDAVIDVVLHRYDFEHVFVLGHSWGGVQATAYLALEPERQRRLAGWILVNGGHNWRLGQTLSVQWFQERAREIIEDPATSSKRRRQMREALEWYDRNPLGSWGEGSSMPWIRRHVQYIDDADGYFLPENRHLMDRLADVPGLSLQSLFAFSGHWAWFQDGNPPLWESQYEYTAAIMDRITLPTLVLWGRHDGILPVALAEDAMDRVGTPSALKRVRIFERTAHSPMFEERDAFNEEVIAFMNDMRAHQLHGEGLSETPGDGS